MRKSLVILSAFLSISASASVQNGIYSGKQDDGKVCSLKLVNSKDGDANGAAYLAILFSGYPQIISSSFATYLRDVEFNDIVIGQHEGQSVTLSFSEAYATAGTKLFRYIAEGDFTNVTCNIDAYRAFGKNDADLSRLIAAVKTYN